ncbi:MarR family transcriptional regulator [Bremerella sp. JC770]|uniref:MarR family winged helix-turn-helix transcriptional regulator n=1 Tax=Bremerella sp. JC770 TaxID=3232137 RepID=UPI003459B05B
MEETDLVERMLRAIRRVILKTSQYSRSLARNSGLTLPQLLCLRAIRDLSQEKDEVTAAQVSNRVGLAAPTVSRILERMERGHLIERLRNSPDRRRVLIHLTETGKAKLAGIPTPLQEQFVNRLTSLHENELRGLVASLEQVVELMEAADLDAEPVISAEYEPREDRSRLS